MTSQNNPQSEPSRPVVGLDEQRRTAARDIPSVSQTEAVAAANRAARTIAPLWPLKSFVAVNPFHGIASFPYADADNNVERIWGARMVMPRSFYAKSIREGIIAREHIEQALEESPGSIAAEHTADSIYLLAFTEEPPPHPIATVAELLSERSDVDWQEFVVDRISFWASGYFDEGQAGWRSPWKDEAPYGAWRGEAELDRTPEIMGIPEFRSIARTLPTDADDLLYTVARDLGLRGDSLSLYFRRLLATVAGWAGHARYLGWKKELGGQNDDRVRELLAIRAAWDLSLRDAFASDHPQLAEDLRLRLTTPLHPEVHKSHAVNLILHTAYEIAGRQELLKALPADGNSDAAAAVEDDTFRPDAQAIFCIDVRSERVRRSLEKRTDRVETLGFAGFFGFALEVATVDGSDSGARCPVLLEPQFRVQDTLSGADPAEIEEHRTRAGLNRQLSAAWKHFSAAAISSFAFVESLGLAYACRLILDSLGIGLKRRDSRIAPSVETVTEADRATGIPLSQRIETARSALLGMSLTRNFARVVALIGHGSTMANNPYASRYHCGACGGHTGEANARVAAAVLNDPEVRAALAGDGIYIPADTLFVGGLHDTTTDEIRLFVTGETAAERRAEVDELEQLLSAAAADARRERAGRFGLPDNASADRNLRRRSTDWSELRPEWGLAGCLSFIAAPRHRTRNIDLGGRAFLHSYDCEKDAGHAVLEVIMTAPLIVASWISLQYYASTIDNRVFGSGDKTLHNVVGGLGVLEGNSGDLRVGLPLQSLHDGREFVHEPMRLNAFIEAPTSGIVEVLSKHDHLRELVDNGWIHLFAITEGGSTVKRYRGGDRWTDAQPVSELANDPNWKAPERRIA